MHPPSSPQLFQYAHYAQYGHIWLGLGQVAKLDQFLLQALYNIGHPMAIWRESWNWPIWGRGENTPGQPKPNQEITLFSLFYLMFWGQPRTLIWSGLGQVSKFDQFLLQALYNICHPMPICPKPWFGLVWARWQNLTNSFYKPFITFAIPCPFAQNLGLAWFGAGGRT